MRKIIAGIYRITSPSEAIYIGKSVNISKRWACYKSKRKLLETTKIASSLKKYGVENHIFEIIHQLPHDVERKSLKQYEILYWEQYKDCGFEMMNLKHPEEGPECFTDETRKKMSESAKKRPSNQKGLKRSVEHNRKNGEARKGIKRGPRSEEVKRKISESHKGKVSLNKGKEIKERITYEELLILKNYNLSNLKLIRDKIKEIFPHKYSRGTLNSFAKMFNMTKKEFSEFMNFKRSKHSEETKTKIRNKSVEQWNKHGRGKRLNN